MSVQELFSDVDGKAHKKPFVAALALSCGLFFSVAPVTAQEAPAFPEASMQEGLPMPAPMAATDQEAADNSDGDITEKSENAAPRMTAREERMQREEASRENGQRQNEAEPIIPPGPDEAELERVEVTKSPDGAESKAFYDSQTIPAATSLSRDAGPRKADPRKEPASRFVIVDKNAGAGSFESHLVAARRALELGRYDSAVQMYQSLMKKNARDQRVLMGLAVAYQKAGNIDSAMRTYQKLVDIDPDNADAQANMVALMREKYPAVALRRLLELREDSPNNPAIVAQIGLAHADLGNVREALEYLGVAASTEPHNPLHYYNMAVVADRAGQAKEARKFYESALEKDAVHGHGRTLPREAIYDRLAKLRSR